MKYFRVSKALHLPVLHHPVKNDAVLCTIIINLSHSEFFWVTFNLLRPDHFCFVLFKLFLCGVYLLSPYGIHACVPGRLKFSTFSLGNHSEEFMLLTFKASARFANVNVAPQVSKLGLLLQTWAQVRTQVRSLGKKGDGGRYLCVYVEGNNKLDYQVWTE